MLKKKINSVVILLKGKPLSHFNFSKEILSSFLFGRMIAAVVIFALLAPIYYFGSFGQVMAQTSFPVRQPALISSLLPIFNLQYSALRGQSLLTPVSSSIVKITDFFTAAQLPEGSENAETVSPFSTYISSFGSSLSAVFSFFEPTKVSAESNNASSSAALPFSPPPAGSIEFDFDGDNKADISRWRNSSNSWQIKQSSDGNLTNLSIGSASSAAAPGDYDGDGITDRAVFNAGVWTIKRSSDGTTYTVSFGTSGDKPMIGDYDGDGKSDPAVFRASTNT